MTEQSQLLAGQLLNELEEINQNLRDSLGLDNLGRTGNLPEASKQITDIVPASAMQTADTVRKAGVEQPPIEFEKDILEEFTQALCDEAESLAELYFSKDFEGSQAVNPQSIEDVVEHIAEFNLKLLNRFLTENNQKKTNTQTEEGHPEKQLPTQQAQAF